MYRLPALLFSISFSDLLEFTLLFVEVENFELIEDFVDASFVVDLLKESPCEIP